MTVIALFLGLIQESEFCRSAARYLIIFRHLRRRRYADGVFNALHFAHDCNSAHISKEWNVSSSRCAESIDLFHNLRNTFPVSIRRKQYRKYSAATTVCLLSC